MKINILTLFPEMFEPVLKGSMLGRADKAGIIETNLVNIRDFSQDKHNKADDYPFGGGVGMVMLPEPLFLALESVDAKPGTIYYMSPRGPVINQERIQNMSTGQEMTIICGHYEGIDQRVLDHFGVQEISIGDYVLTGGELPAMVLIDAVARFIPGVLSCRESAVEESIYSGLLEYPQYTKPREYRGLQVPEVLVSGNHKLIELWKFEKALELTLERRPDLYESFVKNQEKTLNKDQVKILKKVENTRKE